MSFTAAITHIFALPVQWLATLLALPESLNYWNFYLANLFFLTALCLAWWTFYLWHRSKHHFYLALYVFIICLGIIGYFATSLYSYAWLYALIGIMAGTQAVWRIARSSDAPPRIRRFLHHFLVLGLVISLGIPVLYALHHQVIVGRLHREITTQLDDHQTELSKRVESAHDSIMAFSKDEILVRDTAERRYSELTVELQSRMLEKGLQSITVTDPLGTVLSRAHQPLQSGDNLFEQLPWLAPAYNKESVSGIALNERSVPIVTAAEPILKDSQLLGVIVGGYTLNDQFAVAESGRVKESVAIGSSQGIVGMSATTARTVQLFSSAALTDVVRSTARANSTFSSTFQLNAERYVVESRLIPTLAPTGAVTFIATRLDESAGWLAVVDGMIVLVGGILVILSLTSSKELLRRFRRTPKEVVV